MTESVAQSLSFDVRGSGPGLLLIHGTSSTGIGSWGTVVDALALGHTVVLPNLPGSGNSPLPDGPLDPDTVADQIVAAGLAAGLDQFALAGVSLGAPVAIRVTSRYPDRVTRLAALVGHANPRPSLRLRLELWSALFDTDCGPDDEATTDQLLTLLTFSDRHLSDLTEDQLGQLQLLGGVDPAPGVAAQLAFAKRLDVRADAAKLQAPTLVLAGTANGFHDPTDFGELVNAMPGARLVEIDGGDGALLEQPDRVLPVLTDFLDGQS
jgi:pimeloyl-ACP methyl ester carboxylesterase